MHIERCWHKNEQKMKSNITAIWISVAMLSPLLFLGCDKERTTQVQPELAEPKLEREALDDLLPKFSQAWNTGNTGELMKLCAPDSKFSKVEFAWGRLAEDFGVIEKTEIRKYIADKTRFVVRVTYTKRGMMPATFAVKQDGAGNWLIADFNIDGQGEPELNE